MTSFSDKFKELFGRDPSAEELAKAMKLTAKLEKDKVRKALHGNTKNITQENKFKLHKNNGKRDK